MSITISTRSRSQATATPRPRAAFARRVRRRIRRNRDRLDLDNRWHRHGRHDVPVIPVAAKQPSATSSVRRPHITARRWTSHGDMDGASERRHFRAGRTSAANGCDDAGVKVRALVVAPPMRLLSSESSGPRTPRRSIVGVDGGPARSASPWRAVSLEVTVVPVVVPGVGTATSQADISDESGNRIVEAMTRSHGAGVIDAVMAANDRPNDGQFERSCSAEAVRVVSGADNSDIAVDQRERNGAADGEGQHPRQRAPWSPTCSRCATLPTASSPTDC